MLKRQIVQVFFDLTSRHQELGGEFVGLFFYICRRIPVHYGVANLVSSASPVELSIPSGAKSREVTLIVNARVAIDPDILRREVLAAADQTARAAGARILSEETKSFRPGRPVPTHRMTTAV